MARRSDPWRRLILSHLEHAPGSLDQTSGTPPGDKGAREGSIGEVDRDGVIQHSAGPRRRDCPAVCAAVLVEPGGKLPASLAKTVWWNGDADANREAPLGGRDHFAGAARHSKFLVCLMPKIGIRVPGRSAAWAGPFASLCWVTNYQTRRRGSHPMRRRELLLTAPA